MRDGALPALARMASEGGFHTITSVFPSVTGPAYAPLLMGRYPGSVGLPGLRWYDRSRTNCRWPSYARSYVGVGMRHVDRDIAPDVPTMFELATPSLAALSVIGRGLSAEERLGHGVSFAARTAFTHFRGDVRGWLQIDRDIGDDVVYRIRTKRPAFAFAAFTGIDKNSHATGHTSATVREAMQIVDEVAGRIRCDAERDGVWESTQLWIVSDHGHAPVQRHDDLATLAATLGYRVLTHPWAVAYRADVAVMVSGNAMAQLYLAPDIRARQFWAAGQPSPWDNLAEQLLQRPSVDLMVLPQSPHACELRTRDRGDARLSWKDGRYNYELTTGDPLGLGTCGSLDTLAAYEKTIDTDYPDALVQIAALCASPRSGDIILSAARGWDFRGRYEPIPHVSSHGALFREHMLVPLITNHPIATPRRTVDIMPSAAHALGMQAPLSDGVSFITR